MYVRIGRYANDDDSEDFEREIDVVIHNYDTWNMDGTLAYIILPMLKQLKATKQGAPNVDSSDVPNYLKPKQLDVVRYREDGTTDPNFFKRWDWVMDEMIYAFESLIDDNDWEAKYFSGEVHRESVGLGNAQLRLFPDEDGSMEDYEWYEWKKGKNDTSEIDMDGLMKERKRIENGFRLFGKYYQSLWD